MAGDCPYGVTPLSPMLFNIKTGRIGARQTPVAQVVFLVSSIGKMSALAVPFVVVNVTATLYGFDERLEYAAMNLGANRLRTFWHVTLPIIRPGVLAGALFAFITSWDELIVAIFISGTGAVTLPRKMWDSIRFQIDPTIAAVSTLLIIITGSLFFSAEMLRRRSERMRTTVVAEEAVEVA